MFGLESKERIVMAKLFGGSLKLLDSGLEVLRKTWNGLTPNVVSILKRCGRRASPIRGYYFVVVPRPLPKPADVAL